MKVPLSWLREYVAVDGTAADAARTLVMAGVGIEGIEGDVLDLEITSNRADLLSLVGVARELGVLLRKPVRVPEAKVAESGEIGFGVEVPAADLCPRYTARLVRGVRVGPSPKWMAERLEAAGIRAINSIVDVTNYVLLETGQPLHAFDAKLLRGKKIVVRRAAQGEKMTAIDGKEYALAPDMLVIADAERPVAIAGVMGGKETEISPATSDILIESAQFDPVSIRRTSRRLGLASESSYRFERGVDYDGVEAASRRAAQLIVEVAGGKAAQGVVDVSRPRPGRPQARVRPARVAQVLGMDVPAGRVREILAGLGCQVSGTDPFEVGAPPGRRDLRMEADYIEEIARIEGYDKIPCDTSFAQRVAEDNVDDLVREEVRTALSGLGAFEVLTWSFAEAKTPNRVSYWTAGPLIPLRDPQGQVDRTLRESLAPGLLKVLQTNESYKEELRPVFELAHAYFAEGKGYGEKTLLGLAVPGDSLGAKGFLERLLERLGIGLDLAEPARPLPFLEPGTGRELVVEGKRAGYVGAPAAALAELKTAVSIAEADFEALVRAARLVRPYREFNRQPPVQRDLSVMLAEGVTWKEVEEAVRAAAPPSLEAVRFIQGSEYRGKGIDPGHKGWAFSMVFRAADRTLTSEEVDAAVKAIVKALESRFKARQR